MAMILLFVALIEFGRGQMVPTTDVTINIVDDSVMSQHSFTFQSRMDADENEGNNQTAPPTLFPIDIAFTGGECYRPLLSIRSQFIDIDADDEILHFFQRQFIFQRPYLLSACGGFEELTALENGTSVDEESAQCDRFVDCATDIDLAIDLEDQSLDALTLFIFKPEDIGNTLASRCDNFTVNVTFTITCQAVTLSTPSPVCDCNDDDSDDSDDSVDSSEDAAKSEFEQESAIIDGLEHDYKGNEGEEENDRKYVNVNVIIPQGMSVYFICISFVCLSFIFCLGLLYQKSKA